VALRAIFTKLVDLAFFLHEFARKCGFVADRVRGAPQGLRAALILPRLWDG